MIKKSDRRVLAVLPHRVGDAILTHSLLQVLAGQGKIIDVLASPNIVPLLSRLSDINDVISMGTDGKHLDLIARCKVAKQLRKKRYPQAIIVPRAYVSAIIPCLAGIPRRTGYVGEFRWGLINDIRLYERKKYQTYVQRTVGLAYSRHEHWQGNDYPYPKLRVDSHNVSQLVQKYQLFTQQKPVLVLCPGASKAIKCWPAAYYAEVAKVMLAKQWEVWLFGSKKDAKMATSIQSLTHHACLDFTGLSLVDAVDLLSLSQMVVSNDSGMAHIAAALQRPLITVYGPTQSAAFKPLTEKVKVLESELTCRSACNQDYCHLKSNKLQCFTTIKPQRVLDSILDMRA